MSGIKIANGTAASAEQTVDTDGNAHVVTPTDIDLAGYVTLASEIDDGAVLATRELKPLETSDDFRLRVGADTLLFNLSFEGAVITRDRLMQTDTSATSAQTTGKLTLNSGLVTGAGVAAHIRTYRTFPLFGSFPTYGEMWVAHANPTATSVLSEWGFGYTSSTTAQATDGAFFRILSGGALRAIVANNSVDVSAVDITTTNIPPRDGAGTFDLTEVNHYVIAVTNDVVKFWINNVLVANVAVTSPYGSPTNASTAPLFARVYTQPSIASAARQLLITFLNVSQGDLLSGKPWSHQCAGSGGGAYQVQPGTASGSNVLRSTGASGWPTSATARIAGTWTATTAPALASLGGSYTTPAISTLTSDADYPIFSYLNPAGTASLPGRTLYITGVRVGESCVTTVASTNSIVLTHIVGIGSTTTATTASEGIATIAARGIVVGAHAFGASDAVGTMKSGYHVDFSEGPLVCYPGTYVQFIVRPFGTVTSNTLVVLSSVAFIGYYE
jgi:hypothetical protein